MTRRWRRASGAAWSATRCTRWVGGAVLLPSAAWAGWGGSGTGWLLAWSCARCARCAFTAAAGFMQHSRSVGCLRCVGGRVRRSAGCGAGRDGQQQPHRRLFARLCRTQCAALACLSVLADWLALPRSPPCRAWSWRAPTSRLAPAAPQHVHNPTLSPSICRRPAGPDRGARQPQGARLPDRPGLQAEQDAGE